MPNGVKYSTTTPSGSLRRDNVALGVNGNLGPTANTGFYSMPTPASGKYIINKVAASGVPNFFAPQNDTELIQFARNEGATGANTGSAAAVLAWIATQPNLEAANFEYPNIVTDGLVLNLDAGFVGSYPTINTTWYDLSGNTNNGTLTNGPTFNSANSGSIVFDGVDDKVICPNNNNINFNASQSFTTCCWAYLTANSGYEVFMAKHVGGTGYIPNLLWYGSTPELRWWVNNEVNVTYTSNKTYLNQWRFICMSIERPSNIGYIFEDGILVASGSISSSSPANSGQLQIGNDDFNSALSGRISIVQIYNRLLSSSEILQNYNAQKGRFGL